MVKTDGKTMRGRDQERMVNSLDWCDKTSRE
jgi:hypothetical protein